MTLDLEPPVASQDGTWPLPDPVAWFDASGRTHLELGGKDRAKFLHNFCTNDIKALAVGQGCEAFVTSLQGKILGHVFIFAEEECLTLSSVPGSASTLIRHLSKYLITEDVTFIDRSAEWSSLLVVGPLAPARLSEFLERPVPDLDLRQVLHDSPEGLLRIRRNDFLGFPSFELTGATAAMNPMRARCEAEIPCGEPERFKYLRILAGFPWAGIDVGDTNLAQEASRTERAISFRKGCYLGQEPIARIDALGHVNQQLRSLQFAAGELPAPGIELFAMSDPSRPVGRITSAAKDPQGSGFVCLALLKRGHEAPGGHLRLGSTGPEGLVFWNGTA